MEYLGAKIDIDISGFTEKVKSIQDTLSQMSKSGSVEARKFAESFSREIGDVGSKPLNKSFVEMETVLDNFAKMTAKDLGLADNAFNSLLANARQSVEELKKATHNGLASVRDDYNSIIPDKRKIPTNWEDWQTAREVGTLQRTPDFMAQLEQARKAREAEAKETERLTEAQERLNEAKEKETEIDSERDGAQTDEKTRELLMAIRPLSALSGTLGKSSTQAIAELGNDITAITEAVNSGELGVEDLGEALKQLGDDVARISSMKLGKDDKQRMRQLNTELSITKKDLREIIKEREKLQEEEALFQEKMDGILDKYVVSKLPAPFKTAFRVIMRAFTSTGIGALLIALIGYIRKLYEWNEKLIGEKWSNLKDSVSVMLGLADATELATQRRKEHRAEIENETKAIWDNIRAQKEKKTYEEKAEAAASIDDDFEKNLRETFGETAFSFWGKAKNKEFKFLKPEGKAVWDEAMSVLNDPKKSASITNQEMQSLRIRLNDAIELEQAYQKVYKAYNEAKKNIDKRKANGGKGRYDDFIKSELGTDAYEEYKKAQINTPQESEAFKAANREYQAIKKRINRRKELQKQLESLDNKELQEIKGSQARERIGAMTSDQIGGSEWSRLQTEIDDAADALERFNDLRTYQLKLISKEEELRKKKVSVTDSEWASLENLKIEYEALNKQIKYLGGNGVTSKTQNEQIQGLKLDRDALSVRIENETIAKRIELLQREADFKKRVNELDGKAGYALENLQVEIDLRKAKIALLQKQKSLSDAEENQIKNLTLEIDELQRQKALEALSEYNSELERTTDIKNRDIAVTRERNKLESNRKGRTDKQIEADDLELQREQARNTLEMYKTESEKVSEAMERIKAEGKTVPKELSDQLEELRAKIAEAQMALDKLMETPKEESEDFDDIADGITSLGDALGGFDNIVGKAGTSIGDFASSFKSLKDLQGDVAAGKASSKQLGFAGAAMAIENTAKLYTMIHDQIEANKEAQEEWNQAIAEAAHQMALIRIEEFEYEQRNIFGNDDPYAKIEASLQQQQQSKKELADAVTKLEQEGKVQTGTKKVIKGENIVEGASAGALAGMGGTIAMMTAIGAAAGSAAMGVGAIIGAAAGAISGVCMALFAAKEVVPVYESLTSQYGKLYDEDTLELNKEMLANYDKMDDATKQLVDNAKELLETYKAAREEYEQYIADMVGDIGTEMSDALVEAFTNGDVYDAVDTFHDYVRKQMETILSAKVFNAVYGDLIDNLSYTLTDGIASGTEYGSITDVLAGTVSQFEGLTTRYAMVMQALKDSMATIGYDLWEPEDEEETQSAIEGTIASMTEDTASKINGNFMGLKLTAMEINARMASVTECLTASNEALQRSVNLQTEIAENTYFCRQLADVAADVREMRLNGVIAR